MKIIDFCMGFVTGALVVGSSVHRTLAVEHGKVAESAIGSIINSGAYYASIYYVSKDNITAYVGTAVGSTITVIIMALYHRRENGKPNSRFSKKS